MDMGLRKTGKYLLEALVVFLGVMMAFLADSWRESLQDQEEFEMIMNEIKKDIQLDINEIQSDRSRILRQIDCLDQLLEGDLSILDLPRAGRPNFTCLDIIMWYDWPDYVTTGYHQLENSKMVPADYDDELITRIYEYYQWIDYHYLLVNPSISDVQELQKFMIGKGFPPIAEEKISERDMEAFHDLLDDPEFVVRLKYLQYNRREELRIYEEMDEKSRAIIEMFNNTHESQ